MRPSKRALLKTSIDNQVGNFDSAPGLFARRDAVDASNTEPFANRLRRDKSMAATYVAHGSRGVAAEIGETEAEKLRGGGFNESGRRANTDPAGHGGTGLRLAGPR